MVKKACSRSDQRCILGMISSGRTADVVRRCGNVAGQLESINVHQLSLATLGAEVRKSSKPAGLQLLDDAHFRKAKDFVIVRSIIQLLTHAEDAMRRTAGSQKT